MVWLDSDMGRSLAHSSTLRSSRNYTCGLLAFLTALVCAVLVLHESGYSREDLGRLMRPFDSDLPQDAVDADTWPVEANSSEVDVLPSNSSLQIDQHKTTDYEYAPPKAVVVETYVFPVLIPIMAHFAAVLGSSWGMILFTSRQTGPSQTLRNLHDSNRKAVSKYDFCPTAQF